MAPSTGAPGARTDRPAVDGAALQRRQIYVGLVYVYTLFMALPIYLAIEKIDPRLIEAASDLGATPRWVFLRIILPLSWPGVLSGCIMVFLLAMSSFVTPQLLGGPSGVMVSGMVAAQFQANNNWALGATFGLGAVGDDISHIAGGRPLDWRATDIHCGAELTDGTSAPRHFANVDDSPVGLRYAALRVSLWADRHDRVPVVQPVHDHRISIPGLHRRLVREGSAHAAIPQCAAQQHRRRSRGGLDRDRPGAGTDARLPPRFSSQDRSSSTWSCCRS